MKIYIWALIIIVALGGVYYYSTNKEKVTKVDESTMCFAYTSEGNGIKDVYNLSLDIKGDKVTGDLNFLPAEKDSKTGRFSGIVSPFGSDEDTRVIAAWWNVSAEGTNVREQLAILLNKDTAGIGFGEMKDSGNGEYVYANLEEVAYTLSLAKVPCTI
jgi:hypothetical protein